MILLIKKALPIIAVTSLCLTSAEAVLYVYEPFDISDVGNTVNGKATGTGLTGNWNGYDSSANLVIGSGSLSYGDLQAGIGNHVALSSGTDGRTGYSAGLSSIPLTDGAQVWFSFLMQHPSNNTNNRVHFLVGTDGTNAGGNSIANSGSGLGLEINASGGNQMSAMSFTSGTRTNSATTTLPALQTTLIVGRITWGATDTLDLYLPDTSLNFDENAPVRSITATLDQSAFDLLVIAGKWDAPIVDEVRFASTSAEVLPVPEPSTALLGALGVFVLLRRRRS